MENNFKDYNEENYKKLVEELYSENPPITLPAEYGLFVKDNLLRLLIRLARYKFVAKMIKKSDNVLEIGCGSGLGAIFLSQNCNSVVGIDLKNHEIEEAKSINRRENVRFECKNFFDFNNEEKFDAIVLLDVIEHMSEQEGERFIKETVKHLNKDGMLILGTPSIYSYEYQGELSKAAHIKCYDQQELIEVIERSYGRAIPFSMNDEIVHTGFHKMAWYYFVLAFVPKED
jgi:Cyclopropane fatty acid synthase and related methyltransferases